MPMNGDLYSFTGDDSLVFAVTRVHTCSGTEAAGVCRCICRKRTQQHMCTATAHEQMHMTYANQDRA